MFPVVESKVLFDRARTCLHYFSGFFPEYLPQNLQTSNVLTEPWIVHLQKINLCCVHAKKSRIFISFLIFLSGVCSEHV